MESSAAIGWNPQLYQSAHSFVWEHGRGLVELLAPQPGERVLDVGCGTGQLTAEIARAGADVVGVDRSEAMIGQARQNFPSLRFAVEDVTTLPFEREFDAVFSNAALHWVPQAEQAAQAMCRALKPGGRFIVEFGGRGNTKLVMQAAIAALRRLGVQEPERRIPWYYPSISEYAAVLEHSGFEVTHATLFERPTPLDAGSQGLSNWLTMFMTGLIEPLDAGQRQEFVYQVEEALRPALYREGSWFVDYRRLRVVARRAA